MKILRTPDERFARIPDYPFNPHYIDTDIGGGLTARQHYVDEGPRDAHVILLLHGEPSWSFLYRKMIPPLVEAGYRVLAPDLIGLGKSDKPDDVAHFTYARHVAWIEQWREKVIPEQLTLFCQDWGGLLGLRMVGRAPDRFTAVVASNTGLPIGTRPSDAFLAWQSIARESEELPIGAILDRGSVRDLSSEERAAYDAPFPDERFKAAARAFPSLVPIDPSETATIDNESAWRGLKKYQRPFVTCFGDSDPVTKGGETFLIKNVPGARNCDHVILSDCGHFCQEDQPNALVDIILRILV